MPKVAPTPVILLSILILPSTFKSPPTFKFLPIPAPPSTISAPLVLVVDCVPFAILTGPFAVKLSLKVTSSLKVTGPSNCERICPESPPSTTRLFLTITSSKTTLRLDGSSPVTVETGMS